MNRRLKRKASAELPAQGRALQDQRARRKNRFLSYPIGLIHDVFQLKAYPKIIARPFY